MPRSLYIHIPFCAKKCLYCDFYSVPYDRREADRFIGCIVPEIGKATGPLSTVYIGGGTPTMLDTRQWEALLGALGPFVDDQTEFTVEANPDSFDDAKAKLLRRGGVNRISIGLQSLREEKLKALGRIHTVVAGIRAVERAREEGFGSAGIDLIYGVGGEDLESWSEELSGAAALPVQHISCYSLTLEGGTPLERQVRSGFARVPDEGDVASMFRRAIEYLPSRGFLHYEISNFAREGHRARHNMNYWDGGEYIGLGPSAVSFTGGVRSKNVGRIGEYCARLGRGESPRASGETLGPAERAREIAAFKIRTRDGIGRSWFSAATGYDLFDLEREPIDGLIAEGLLERYAGNDGSEGIRLTADGCLFCDRVSSAFV